MKIIFDYNRTIFNPEVGELYLGVFELLKDLASEHDLYLITQAEDYRHAQLQGLGIDSFFKEILYVDKKDKSQFAQISSNTFTIVVGDRIKGEIVLGNELNLVTIWVKQGKHARILPENKLEEPKHTVLNIVDIKEIINFYE